MDKWSRNFFIETMLDFFGLPLLLAEEATEEREEDGISQYRR